MSRFLNQLAAAFRTSSLAPFAADGEIIGFRVVVRMTKGTITQDFPSMSAAKETGVEDAMGRRVGGGWRGTSVYTIVRSYWDGKEYLRGGFTANPLGAPMYLASCESCNATVWVDKPLVHVLHCMCCYEEYDCNTEALDAAR